MIICKSPAPPDDYLQEAGPSGWSFARGRSLGMIIFKEPVPQNDKRHNNNNNKEEKEKEEGGEEEKVKEEKEEKEKERKFLRAATRTNQM